MEIKQDLAAVLPGKNCFGRMNKKKFLVIHQTGNAARGANAQMHAAYQINNTKYKDPREASWHWQADCKEAIQSFTHDVSCYHASDGSGDGNMHSIAIEGCINADGNYVKSVENMARLAAKILKDEKISIMNMKQHYDFARDKKNCPAQIRGGKDGIDWAKFVQMVQRELDLLNGKPVVESVKVEVPKPIIKTIDQLAQEVIDGKHGSGTERKESLGAKYNDVQKRVNEILAPKPVIKSQPVAKPQPKPIKTGIEKKYAETGSFRSDYTIIVRDQPSISGKIVARYYKGETLDKYKAVHIGNGHVWLQYDRMRNGKVIGQGYLPCREYANGVYGMLWGTLK